jgi:hypothetical protein
MNKGWPDLKVTIRSNHTALQRALVKKNMLILRVLPRLHQPRRRWRQMVEVMLMLCYLFCGFS